MNKIIILFLLLSGVCLSQDFRAGAIIGMNTSQVSGDNLAGFNKLGIRVGGFVNKEKQPYRITAPSATEQDPNAAALETDLSDLLGLKVSIKFRGTGGELVVHYKTLDQLDDVLRRLKSATDLDTHTARLSGCHRTTGMFAEETAPLHQRSPRIRF